MTESDKENIIQLLRAAKLDYLEWHAGAERLICGVASPDQLPPEDFAHCRFGVWCESDGKRLLGGRETFVLVRNAHHTLHGVYEQIHRLVEQGRADEARDHLPDMVAALATLDDAILLLEREVRALPG